MPLPLETVNHLGEYDGDRCSSKFHYIVPSYSHTRLDKIQRKQKRPKAF
jgi:hypothetical protein